MNIYEIRIPSLLDPSWKEIFHIATLVHDQDRGETILRGPLDQAKLQGILVRIHGMGLQLISVKIVSEGETSDADTNEHLNADTEVSHEVLNHGSANHSNDRHNSADSDNVSKRQALYADANRCGVVDFNSSDDDVDNSRLDRTHGNRDLLDDDDDGGNLADGGETQVDHH